MKKERRVLSCARRDLANIDEPVCPHKITQIHREIRVRSSMIWLLAAAWLVVPVAAVVLARCAATEAAELYGLVNEAIKMV